MSHLNILSGGAAHGLVASLAPSFKASTGFDITGEFGAVGAMADKLRNGVTTDIVILTKALVGKLADEKLIVGVQVSRADELVAVDERAVGRLEVLDRCRAIGRRRDARVLRGCLAVFEHKVSVRTAANYDRFVQRELLARVGSFDDFQVQFARHGAAAYRRRRSFRNIR